MLWTLWLISKNFHQIPYITHFKSTPPYHPSFFLRLTNLPQILHFQHNSFQRRRGPGKRQQKHVPVLRASGNKRKGLPSAVRSQTGKFLLDGGESGGEKDMEPVRGSPPGGLAPVGVCAWTPQSAVLRVQFSRQKPSQLTVRNTLWDMQENTSLCINVKY